MDTVTATDVADRFSDATSTRAALSDRLIIQRAAKGAASAALAVAVGFLCIPPVYFVVDTALLHGASGVRQMFDDPALGSTLRTTVALAVGSALISTVLGTMLAWGAQGLTGKRKWLGYIPLAPLLMPFLAAVTGYQYLLDPRIGFGNMFLRKILFSSSSTGPLNVNTVIAIVVITGILLTSFVYLFVRSALAQLDQGIYDAAAASGASPSRSFFTVILPMLRPALVYASLTVVLLALGQFEVPIFFGRQQNITVLATAMFSSISNEPPDLALAAAYGLPIIVFGLAFIVFQRLVLRDQDRFVSAGAKGASRSLGKSGWLSQAALVVYGLLAVAGPIISVAIVAVQPYWSKNIDPRKFTLANFRTVLHNPELMSAITNSIGYSLVATAIAIPLSFLCARVLYRRRKQPILANIVDVLVSLPLGIPAAIFGVGFLLAYLRGPLNLYGKGAGLVVVYIVISLPFLTRILFVGLVNLGNSLVDAGAVCGGPLWRRTLELEVRMLRPALGNATALCIIFTTHEFAASLLVRSTKTQVMGTVLYDQFIDGSNSAVAVMAFIMCAITGVGVLLAFALARQPKTRSERRFRRQFVMKGSVSV